LEDTGDDDDLDFDPFETKIENAPIAVEIIEYHDNLKDF
jgi:hypothetical protein